jgi:phosphatidate cytidylyltransferase
MARAAASATRPAMSPLVSRVLFAALLLPPVLGLVYLGGWWLAALAALVALIALHEAFQLLRPYRPVVLAGFAGGVGTIVAARLGGPEWVLAAFVATLPLAFLLKSLGGTRGSTTVSVAATVLASAWVGLGLAHIVLLRELEFDGVLAVFTVLLAVFADDTAAYFAGRLFGRHKLAPAISPGKTWEGFLVGSAAAIFVVWIALYETGFMDGYRSFVLGAVIAVAAPLGDLFESAVKREAEVKDAGRLLGAHGGMLDRLDAHLFAAIAAFYVIAAYGFA